MINSNVYLIFLKSYLSFAAAQNVFLTKQASYQTLGCCFCFGFIQDQSAAARKSAAVARVLPVSQQVAAAQAG
jgi:hypothetical protein